MKRKSRGFTLLEMTLVLSMAAVLLALLMPAIQKARIDARFKQCKNNLKMLGLALHNYHDATNTFPPAWVSVDGMVGSGPKFGWQAMLLPYMDQAPLYNRFEFTSQPEKDALTQTEIKTLRCPADSTPKMNPLRGEFGTSNYSANFGFIAPPRLAPLGLADLWPGQIEAPMKSTGLFARNSCIRVRDITDGTSNTFMVGERSFSSGAAIWIGISDDAHDDDAVTDCSHASRINAGPTSYSSRHPDNTANFLLGDGSVRAIQADIESKGGDEMGLYQKLAGRNDGQVIREF